MKVFLQYKRPEDEDGFYMLKLTLNKAWSAYPISKVKKMFCDSYNKKYPLIPFTSETTTGSPVHDDDIIEKVCENMGTIMFQLGAPPVRKSVEAIDHKGMDRCTNYGCFQWYKPEENHPKACCHHTAPPVFHDASKGWSCCQKRVYDWDEFNKIPGCTAGAHNSQQKAESFAPSPTIAAINAAANAAFSSTPSSPLSPVPASLKSIEEYNMKNPNAPSAVKSVEKIVSDKPQPVPMKDGKAQCLHIGCNQWFEPSNKDEECCVYHKGKPVFHDGEKFWSCCPQKKCYDFDEFMKVPGCSNGKHDDGRE